MTLPVLIIFVVMGAYLLFLEYKLYQFDKHLIALASSYLDLIEVLDAKGVINAVYEGGDHE
jgi:hypothetical protein